MRWYTHQDTPWCSSTTVSVHDTYLLIRGFKIKDDEYTQTSNVYKLNKASHSWKAIGHIISLTRSTLAAVSTADSRVIVIAGKNDEGQHTNTVRIGSCDPQPTGQWSLLLHV